MYTSILYFGMNNCKIMDKGYWGHGLNIHLQFEYALIILARCALPLQLTEITNCTER